MALTWEPPIIRLSLATASSDDDELNRFDDDVGTTHSSKAANNNSAHMKYCCIFIFLLPLFLLLIDEALLLSSARLIVQNKLHKDFGVTERPPMCCQVMRVGGNCMLLSVTTIFLCTILFLYFCALRSAKTHKPFILRTHICHKYVSSTKNSQLFLKAASFLCLIDPHLWHNRFLVIIQQDRSQESGPVILSWQIGMLHFIASTFFYTKDNLHSSSLSSIQTIVFPIQGGDRVPSPLENGSTTSKVPTKLRYSALLQEQSLYTPYQLMNC